MKKHTLIPAFILAVALATPSFLPAQIDPDDMIFWDDKVDGAFDDTTKWDPQQIPGNGDFGMFNNDAGASEVYTVTLDQNRDIEGISVQTDRVILDLDGFDLTALSPTIGTSASPTNVDNVRGLMVGVGASGSENGHLTITGGGTYEAVSMIIGGEPTGHLTVQGANTVLRLTPALGDTSSTVTAVGIRGTGHVHILDGARLEMIRPAGAPGGDSYIFTVGRNNSGVGNVTVSGTGSVLSLDEFLAGGNGAGNILIEDGGHLETLGNTILVDRAQDGNFTIDNATADVGGSFALGTSRVNGPRTATLNILNGGLLEVASLLGVGSNSTQGGSTEGIVNLSGGSELKVGGNLDLRASLSGAEAFLNVSDSTVEVGGNLIARADSFIDIEDDSTVTIDGNLDLQTDSEASLSTGSTMAVAGSLDLQTGSEMSLSGGSTVTAGTYSAQTGALLEISGGASLTTMDFQGAESVFTLTLQTGVFTPAIDASGDGFFFFGTADVTDMDFSLFVESGFTSDLGDVFEVLRYQDNSTLTGTFAGLNTGDVLTVSGWEFQIDFGSGTDDAITLTVIPEPSTGLLLAAAALIPLLRRRRR